MAVAVVVVAHNIRNNITYVPVHIFIEAIIVENQLIHKLSTSNTFQVQIIQIWLIW